MGIKTETTYTCDKCGKVMETTYGHEYVAVRGKATKIIHEVPCWNRTDKFLLCNDCGHLFMEWLKGEKDEGN